MMRIQKVFGDQVLMLGGLKDTRENLHGFLHEILLCIFTVEPEVTVGMVTAVRFDKSTTSPGTFHRSREHIVDVLRDHRPIAKLRVTNFAGSLNATVSGDPVICDLIAQAHGIMERRRKGWQQARIITDDAPRFRHTMKTVNKVRVHEVSLLQ